MKMTVKMLYLLLGLWVSISVLGQPGSENQKLSVNDRLAKARAAKAQKKGIKKANPAGLEHKAMPADYQAPVVKTEKGPHGEVVHIGTKGGKYYINKNGNKTYLSSNQ